MQPVNQQKAILIVAVLAVVALLATTFFSNGFLLFNLSEQEKNQIAKNQEQIKQSLKFNPDSGVDETASKILWQQVLDPVQMRVEIEAELGVGAPYKTPVVDSGLVQVVENPSINDYEKYLSDLKNLLNKARQDNEGVLPTASGYNADPVSSFALAENSAYLLEQLYSMQVPEEAKDLHLSILRGVISQEKYAKNNDLAIRSLLPRGSQWSLTANTFSAFVEATNDTEASSQKLASYLNDKFLAGKEANPVGIKTAHAAIPIITTADIPREIRELLEAFISMFVTNYTKNTVMKYVEQAEKQFLITNYLHYTDALVDQKYATSFLDKYVEDPKQRQIIRQLLPQFSCGKTDVEAIKKTLRDEALSYLGYDPKNLDYRDPNLYDKIVESSAPSSTGAAINADAALLFNRSLAIVTEYQAQRAANQELIAPGKKVPVSNDQKKDIQVSLDYLTSKLQSAIKTIFDLVLPTSASTGKGSLAGVVVSAVGQIIQQFGVANAVVIKEQATCIGGGAGVFNPIVPPNPGSADVDLSDDYIRQCVSNPAGCGLILSQGIVRKYS